MTPLVWVLIAQGTQTEQERGPAHTGFNKALKSRNLSGGSYQEEEHREGEEEVEMSQKTEASGENNQDATEMTKTVSVYKALVILRASHTHFIYNP